VSSRRESGGTPGRPEVAGVSGVGHEGRSPEPTSPAAEFAAGASAGTKAGAPTTARTAASSDPDDTGGAGTKAGAPTTARTAASSDREDPGGAGTKAGAPAKARLGEGGRVNLDPESTRNGVAQLVLALINFLHELLERQAVRRMEAGALSDEEIERLGVALMKQAEELKRLAKEFGLEEEDLNLDLGPLGKLV
jgi:hypothetical protein